MKTIENKFHSKSLNISAEKLPKKELNMDLSIVKKPFHK